MTRFSLLTRAMIGFTLMITGGNSFADHFHSGHGQYNNGYAYRGPANFDNGAGRFGSPYQGTFYNGTLYRGPSGYDSFSGNGFRNYQFGSQWNNGVDYGAYRGYGSPNFQNFSPSNWNQLNHCTPYTNSYPQGYSGYGGYNSSFGVYPR